MQQEIRTKTDTDRGFTLPELLIVMVLMGILAAIAVPSFFGFIDGRNSVAAANQVTADLRLAHSEARNQLSSVTVTPNTSTNCYEVSGATTRNRCLPDGSKFVTSVTAVEFKSNGEAVISGPGDIAVTRASRNTAEYTIRINTQTSRIEVV